MAGCLRRVGSAPAQRRFLRSTNALARVVSTQARVRLSQLARIEKRALGVAACRLLRRGARVVTQAATVRRCCAALFALSFLPLAVQVVLPNYSFKATVMCRGDNLAHRPAP